MQARGTERGRGDLLTSLVFPAYNPGPRAERTWAEVRRFLDEAPGLWEVVFVCDGCTDGTPERLAGLARHEAGRVRVLSYAPNRGKGHAVRHGLRAARGAWRLFTDIDLAYGLDDVLRVARALWDGAEVAVASRTHPHSRLVVPVGLQGYAYRRHLQSLVFSALARLLLPLKQTDTQAGLKGLSARAAWLALPHLTCDGFGFDCELLTACARYGLPVTEVPVQVRVEDRASTTGPGTVGRMVRELWQIRKAWRKAPPAVAMPVGPGRREAARRHTVGDRVDSERYLVVVADDYGIGPETSRGILELARRGAVTATVLLVNSPHAEAGVAAWRRDGAPLEVGWHPCLTLDAPLLPPARVPSLVGADGRFRPLGRFLRRLLLRRVRPAEIADELRAQYRRFLDLVGRPPAVVNAHHHVQVFPPVGPILKDVLAGQRPRPFVRRVREPWRLLAAVPGARGKRAVLSLLGRRSARRLAGAGFPGADWHVGITDPPCVADPDFFARWLRQVPGRVVELCCHPGRLDATLLGRDCTAGDGQMQRRVREHELLGRPDFLDACRAAGFTLVSPARLREGAAHAA